LGQKDHLTAVGAIRKMCERDNALVLGQHIFSEGAELIGREVRHGLEVVWLRFNHGWPWFAC
jgi:hypothetical protein